MSRGGGLFWGILVGGALLDQATKALALRTLGTVGSVSVAPFFSFTLVRNPGVGFGFFGDGSLARVVTPAVILASLAVLAVIIRHVSTRPRPALVRVALGMVGGGIAGNLVDRVGRGGEVVDFLDFRVWPVFNLADTLIVTGVCLLLALHLGILHAPGLPPGR